MTLSFNTKRQTRRGSVYNKGVYPDDFTEEFKQSIRERDSHRCVVCGHKRKAGEHNLDVHHINFRKDTSRLNCISLCRSCHQTVHSDDSWAWRHLWRKTLYQIVLHREGYNKLSILEKRRLIAQMRKAVKEMK